MLLEPLYCEHELVVFLCHWSNGQTGFVIIPFFDFLIIIVLTSFNKLLLQKKKIQGGQTIRQ